MDKSSKCQLSVCQNHVQRLAYKAKRMKMFQNSSTLILKIKKKPATSIKVYSIWDLPVNHTFNIIASMDNKITKIALI